MRFFEYIDSASCLGIGCQPGSPSTILQAVSAVIGKSFTYDCNGNMTGRTISGTTYTLGYDAENRMVKASWESNTNDYKYDGNGARVKSVVGGVTTVFIGGYYECVTKRPIMYQWHSPKMYQKYSPTLRHGYSPTMYQ